MIDEMKVKIDPYDIEVECGKYETLFECMRHAGIQIAGICGGNGTCRKCVIELIAGKLDFIEDVPAFRRPVSKDGKNRYYACLVRPVEDSRIFIPEKSIEENFITHTDFKTELIGVIPYVQRFVSNAVQASFDNLLADTERVIKGLDSSYQYIDAFDPMVLKMLSGVLKKNGGHVSLAVYKGEVIQIGSIEDKYYAIAVDIGSTKIAVYLLELESGKRISSGGILNPQTAYGADIISRLSSAVNDPATAKKLQQMVVEKINNLTEELCKESAIPRANIVFSVFVGNTAMHHLFFGLETNQLLEPPYVPVTAAESEFKTRELGVSFSPGAYGYSMPIVAGYVGSDHISMLLAAGALEDKNYVMYIDIGTNTEICLATPEVFYSLSAPSGPAFEGAHIQYGMRALPGAIDTAYIDGRGKIHYTTIGNKRPKGICGSGIIDLIAAAFTHKIVDWRGRLSEHKMVTIEREEKRFIIGPENEIYLSQKDIREFQLAKGAITSGIYALVRKAGIELAEVNKLIVSGAFGSYINVENALRIGLFPFKQDIPFEQIGNAAGAGACMAAVDQNARERVKDIRNKIVYIELVKSQGFKELYARSTYLGNPFIED